MCLLCSRPVSWTLHRAGWGGLLLLPGCAPTTPTCNQGGAGRDGQAVSGQGPPKMSDSGGVGTYLVAGLVGLVVLIVLTCVIFCCFTRRGERGKKRKKPPAQKRKRRPPNVILHGWVCFLLWSTFGAVSGGDSAHWPLVAFSGLTNGQEWPKRANWSSTSQTRKMATETSCLLAVGSASGQGQIYIHTLGIFSVSGACVQNASTYPFPKGSLLWTS